MRLREIEKIIMHRHGQVIPDPTGTDDVELCVAYIKAAAFALSGQDMAAWCQRWAPWVDETFVLLIVAQAATRKLMMPANAVAALLSVSWKERTEIGLTTIGAFDVSASERSALARQRKRERDRERQESKRRADGRGSHAASLARSKPWEEEGISRASWFRKQRETKKSRAVYNRGGDISVSHLISLPHMDDGSGFAVSSFTTSIVDRAAGRWGSGKNSPAEVQEAEPHGDSDVQSRHAA
jgi:hypothetical protein